MTVHVFVFSNVSQTTYTIARIEKLYKFRVFPALKYKELDQKPKTVVYIYVQWASWQYWFTSLLGSVLITMFLKNSFNTITKPTEAEP